MERAQEGFTNTKNKSSKLFLQQGNQQSDREQQEANAVKTAAKLLH